MDRGSQENDRMPTAKDLSPWYGAHYFRTYRTAPYERSAKWLGVFAGIADGIIREINPKTVLDVGCAMGFLVEALRDRGVEAYGVDLSEHAIAQVRDDIKPYCRVGSMLEESPKRVDLVVCHEVIEHLPADQAEAAIARLCATADDVLFSSTPDHFDEDTHINVRPTEYWAGLFARHGFVRDFNFDGSAFLAPWAIRFRRNAEPMHRIVSGYERQLWALTSERAALRERALETAATLARQDEALRGRPEVGRLEATVAEQQEHLDALNERLQFMTDHETELRRMLMDAHEQLADRDAGRIAGTSQSLQALVEERTAWAQNAVAELERCRAIVADLQAYQSARFPLLRRIRKFVRERR
jgi:SAM-dependent methyltransferase